MNEFLIERKEGERYKYIERGLESETERYGRKRVTEGGKITGV